jgi:NAD(P)H-nitrite reductase large subunit
MGPDLVSDRPDDPVICVCAQVTEDQICSAIRGGATTIAEVCVACGANAVCHSCTEDIEELIADVG